MVKLFCILGPTATGKTDLGLFLAKKFNGELIASDSRQVYIGLDIGTGKLPATPAEIKKGKGYWEIEDVKIWMYDIVDLNTQYTVALYVRDVEKIIEDIINRGKIPIIVGGTGLYIKALLEGLPNLVVPVDENLRGSLSKLNLEELQNKLRLLSPVRWKELNNSDRQNPRRLLRAIEISSINPGLQSPRTITGGQVYTKYQVLKIGLTAPRDVLYKKVDLRVFDWIEQGIIEEVKGFLKNGISIDRIKSLGLEYRVVADFIDGKLLEKDLVKTIQNNIHGYVRRQLTWFKNEREVNWFDITEKKYLENVENLSRGWYHNSNDQKD